MVRRALGPASSRDHDFLPLQLNAPDTVAFLADATPILGGLDIKFSFGRSIDLRRMHTPTSTYLRINLRRQGIG